MPDSLGRTVGSLVKKNLEEQVKKFQTMAETMRRRKDDMLAKVEKRKTAVGSTC